MQPERHTRLTDDAFEQKFADCTLAPVLFSHEAHLRLAYIHLKKYGVATAEKQLCTHIERYANKWGATGKYNKTVTVASARVMCHFMQKATSDDFAGLMTEFPRLKTNFKDLLKQHYSTNIFASPEAKTKFLEPDLLPF